MSKHQVTRVIADIQTEAVLSIDDDIMVSCSSLEAAFNEWKEHPHNLVGWFPRHFTRNAAGQHTYRSKTQTLMFDRAYSIVLTKAAFLHHRFLGMYTSQMPPEILKMVKEWRNCEDIAMQFLVSNTTKSTPWFVWEPRFVVLDIGLSKLVVSWPDPMIGAARLPISTVLPVAL